MAKLTLTDLPVNSDLDLAARQEIHGAYFPMSSIVAFIETLQFTQNATTINIFNEGTGGTVFNNIATSSLSAASPMQVLQMSAPIGAPTGEADPVA